MIDADRLVAELYQPGGEGAAAVRDLFGPEMLDEQRRRGSRQGRGPRLQRPRGARLPGGGDPSAGEETVRGDRGPAQGVVVLEATLLVEAGYGPGFDLIVTVEAPASCAWSARSRAA